MTLARRTLGLSVPITEVLDPVFWRTRYAFGVNLSAASSGGGGEGSLAYNLCLQRGTLTKSALLEARKELEDATEQLDPAVIAWHLRSALSEVELEVGIPMGVTISKADPSTGSSATAQELLAAEGYVLGTNYDRIVPRLPYRHTEAVHWYSIPVPPGTITIDRIRAYFFGQLLWEMSPARGNLGEARIEWAKEGAIHLIPSNYVGFITTAPGGLGGQASIFPPWTLTAMRGTPIPSFWAVDSTQGPTGLHDDKAGFVPAVVADYVYSLAGIKLLSMAGLARSAGLSSTSLSFDGFSRSVGLQASAIYGLNSALEHVLDENRKRINPKALKRAMRGIRVLSTGP